MPSSPPTPSLTQCVVLALLSIVLASCVKARSVDADASRHTDAKRFYIPVVISSDAILASLRDRQRLDDSSDVITDTSGLERKRTAARFDYLESLLPRSVEPKRKMFFSPLGYMSASARRLNQNNPGGSMPANKEDAGSHGFRYG